METNKQNKLISSGAIFVGCMFIGLGLGFLFNAVTPGVLLGMGVGFIAKSVYEERSLNQEIEKK